MRANPIPDADFKKTLKAVVLFEGRQTVKNLESDGVDFDLNFVEERTTTPATICDWCGPVDYVREYDGHLICVNCDTGSRMSPRDIARNIVRREGDIDF